MARYRIIVVDLEKVRQLNKEMRIYAWAIPIRLAILIPLMWGVIELSHKIFGY